MVGPRNLVSTRGRARCCGPSCCTYASRVSNLKPTDRHAAVGGAFDTQRTPRPPPRGPRHPPAESLPLRVVARVFDPVRGTRPKGAWGALGRWGAVGRAALAKRVSSGFPCGCGYVPPGGKGGTHPLLLSGPSLFFFSAPPNRAKCTGVQAGAGRGCRDKRGQEARGARTGAGLLLRDRVGYLFAGAAVGAGRGGGRCENRPQRSAPPWILLGPTSLPERLRGERGEARAHASRWGQTPASQGGFTGGNFPSRRLPGEVQGTGGMHSRSSNVLKI